MHPLAIASVILVGTQVAFSAPASEYFLSARTRDIQAARPKGHVPRTELPSILLHEAPPEAKVKVPPQIPASKQQDFRISLGPSKSTPANKVAVAKANKAAVQAAKNSNIKGKPSTLKRLSKSRSSAASLSQHLRKLRLQRRFKRAITTEETAPNGAEGIEAVVSERDMGDENDDASTIALRNTLRELFKRELTTWIIHRTVDGLSTSQTLADLD
ncbi:hypothetical protein K439DRAFT_1663984 [Ramaria rubella]|nr:hypothetical protein K439DRAFT_1663984 [Ramaria rubella]